MVALFGATESLLTAMLRAVSVITFLNVPNSDVKFVVRIRVKLLCMLITSFLDKKEDLMS